MRQRAILEFCTSSPGSLFKVDCISEVCMYIYKKKPCRKAAWKIAVRRSSTPVTSYLQKLHLLIEFSLASRAGLKAGWQCCEGSKSYL